MAIRLRKIYDLPVEKYTPLVRTIIRSNIRKYDEDLGIEIGLIKSKYQTNIEAIMDINTKHNDAEQLLNSLEAYLINGTETLTKEQYNRVNRELGRAYVKTLEEGMNNGEVKREDVLRVNKMLSQYTWEQYNKITGKKKNSLIIENNPDPRINLGYEKFVECEETIVKQETIDQNEIPAEESVPERKYSLKNVKNIISRLFKRK